MNKFIMFPFAAQAIDYDPKIINDLYKKGIPYVIIKGDCLNHYSYGFNTYEQSNINKQHYFLINDVMMYFDYAKLKYIRICGGKQIDEPSKDLIYQLIEQKVPFDLGMFHFKFYIDDIFIKLTTNLSYKFRYTNDEKLFIYVQDSYNTGKKLSDYDKKQFELYKLIECV